MPDAPSEFRYKRVLLKVSGEVLMGDQPYGIDQKTVARHLEQDALVAELGWGVGHGWSLGGGFGSL